MTYFGVNVPQADIESGHISLKTFLAGFQHMPISNALAELLLDDCKTIHPSDVNERPEDRLNIWLISQDGRCDIEDAFGEAGLNLYYSYFYDACLWIQYHGNDFKDVPTNIKI